MQNAVLATVAALLWLLSYGLFQALFCAGDLRRWWGQRAYRRPMSEIERLAEARAYAAWVRDMPPAPHRAAVAPPVVPMPEVPPIRGIVLPFPGRRLGAD